LLLLSGVADRGGDSIGVNASVDADAAEVADDGDPSVLISLEYVLLSFNVDAAAVDTMRLRMRSAIDVVFDDAPWADEI